MLDFLEINLPTETEAYAHAAYSALIKQALAVPTLPHAHRRQDNVDETVAELRSKGLQVSGVVCHVGNAQHRQALVDRTIQVGECSYGGAAR